MAMDKGRYLAYLLRMWQVDDDGTFVWRASLQNPHTGERQGFTNFEALLNYLRDRICEAAPETETDQENTIGE